MDYKLKILLAFVAAVLVTTVLGSIFQSQHTMAAMSEIGPPIPMGDRFETIVADLARFAPLYLLVVTPTFLVAFLVAELISVKAPGFRFPLLLLAAVAGLWVAFPLIDNILMPATMITATRTGSGTALMVAGAFVGGLVYALMTLGINWKHHPRKRQHHREAHA